MNNSNAEMLLNKSKERLDKMKAIIDGLGWSSNIVPYFNAHGAVIASGAIEQAFKTIIADAFLSNPSPQLRKFIDSKIRESSMNPSLDNIHNTLKSFDENWNSEFKNSLSNHPDSSQIKDSFKSLVNARNLIAHGRDSTITLVDIINNFEKVRIAINMIDEIVN